MLHIGFSGREKEGVGGEEERGGRKGGGVEDFQEDRSHVLLKLSTVDA